MRRQLFIFFLSIGVLYSCGSKETPKSGNNSFVVKVAQVEQLSGVTKDFTGVAESDKVANLAFRVGGQIMKMLVSDGQAVKQGQLIAELDPTDINLELEAQRSQYSTSKTVLERNRRLLTKQAISQQDYEAAETQFVLAKANYEGALNKLSYSKLKAPFGGIIEKKLVENYQKVNPGEGVVRLVQPSNLLIWFTIPDNMLESIRGNASYSIEFDAFKGRIYKAKVKEFIDSSPDGTGIPVSLVIDDPSFKSEELFIKPGFAARIIMNVNQAHIPANLMRVPITALFTDSVSGEQSVWVVNEDNTVLRKAVKVERPADDHSIIVSDGIGAGQTIVIAGVNKLTEGSQVKPIN